MLKKVKASIEPITMNLPQKTEVRVEPQNWRIKVFPNGISSLGALSYEGSEKPGPGPTLSNRRKSEKMDVALAEMVYVQGQARIGKPVETTGPLAFCYRVSQEFKSFMKGLTGKYVPPKAQVRGFKGITRYGRDMVTNAAYLMEQHHGLSNLVMGLGTIPNDYSRGAKNRIHTMWPTVMGKAKRAIRYWLRKNGEMPELVGVYEVQEKRFKRYGEPVLHFHFLMPLHGDEQKRDAFNEWWRGYWTDLLDKTAEEKTEYLAVGEAQWVRSDASAYIGKYLSKGAGVVQEMCAKGFRSWVPPTWWFMTTGLRLQIKAGTIEIYGVPRACVERLKEVALGNPIENCIEWAAAHLDYKEWKGYAVMRSARFALAKDFMADGKVGLMEWVQSFWPSIELPTAVMGWF
jgi:hypothetical protein